MSQFVVSARKYRPLKFDDVVGQEHVSKTLKNAIRQNTLAHAFLFCGPRGVGKTTCARILAKVLNCQNVSEETEPCGKCDSCVSFDNSASLNILELDAASNNSVEHIRSLNEQVRFQPQEGAYKIFIIDEVHMLSQQAFNAFLKTLEEPPSYAIFILATTEKHKIIPTILSRCQIFDFKRIQVEDIVLQLKEICTEEGITADQEALFIIANKADGALRDALSIFDKVASFGNKKITYADVISNLNVLDYEYFFKVVESLLVGNVASILNLFDQIQKLGFDGDIFLNGLGEHIRNLLVCKHQSIHHLLSLSESLLKQYMDQSKVVDEGFLLGVLDVINEGDLGYKMAKNKRLHVEMALIKMNFLQHRILSPSTPTESQEKKNADLKDPSISDQMMATSSKEDADPKSLSSEEDEKPEEISETVEQEEEQENASLLEPIIEEEPLESIPEQEQAPKEKLPDKNPEQKEKTSEQKPKPVGFSIPAKGNLATSAIGSLSQLVEAAEKRFGDVNELRTEIVTLEQVDTIWNKYAQDQTSQTVRAVLERTVLEVKNNVIVANVASPISKTVILQEAALIERLRSELQVPKLTIKIEIDQAALKHSPTKKILTTKEKFAHLCEQNPYFKSFQDKFGLKHDQE